MRDAVSAAVIRESFSSIVREMRRAFAASAYSSIIYEGYDFSCVLIDREGQLVAQSGEDHPFHIIPVAWSVSTLLEKGVKIDPELIKIGAKVVMHSRYVTFQMAEVMVSRSLFCDIIQRIGRLRPVPIGYG